MIMSYSACLEQTQTNLEGTTKGKSCITEAKSQGDIGQFIRVGADVNSHDSGSKSKEIIV